MVDRVLSTSNIEVKYNHELIGIEGENFLVERAKVVNNLTDEVSTIDVHGIFIAIGHKPNTGNLQRANRPRRERIYHHGRQVLKNQSSWSFRGWRCSGSPLQTGDYSGGKWLYGGNGCGKNILVN